MNWRDGVRAIAGIFFIQLDEETRRVWQRYQLAIAPMFLGVVSMLVLAIAFRNILIGQASTMGPLVVFGVIALLALSGWLFKQLFVRLLNMIAFFVIPAMIYQYFVWPAAQPSPTLLLLSTAVMIQASANDVRLATLYLVTGLVLLVHNALGLALTDWNNISYVLGVGITMCMLYLAAIVLWVRLTRLFKTHTGLMESIRQSIEVRRSLLKIFYDEISGPLDSLIRGVSAAEVDWHAISGFNQTLMQAIGKARTITLEVGKKLSFSPQNLAKEVDQIRHDSWMAIAHCATGVIVMLLVIYLLGPWPVRIPLLVALPVTLLISRAAKEGVKSLLLRKLTIYVMTALIAWACFKRLEAGDQLYIILYFMVVIFSAVIVSGIADALLVSAVTALIIGWWYLAVPSLPFVETVIRSNMIIVLLFTTSFSVIMGYWLARIMDEIHARETNLLIETDLRQRLMATLFHDVANPLQVIIARVEFVLMGTTAPDDAMVVKDIACKIRHLLEVTRELEELDLDAASLPLETVSLTEVFADLQQLFADRLAAKRMSLLIVPTDQLVMAQRAILSMSVFANLLTNAIKFSPRGSTIRIVASASHADTIPLVSVSVIDEGAGIPAGTIAKMHGNEQIVSTPGTEGEEGHGQGLRLASLYLSKMGGRLQLEAGTAVKVILQSAGLVQP